MNRNLNTLLAFHRYYHLEGPRILRRRLIRNELGDLTKLDEHDANEVQLVVDQLELLAILVERKLVDFELVLTVFPSRLQEFGRP